MSKEPTITTPAPAVSTAPRHSFFDSVIVHVYGSGRVTDEVIWTVEVIYQGQHIGLVDSDGERIYDGDFDATYILSTEQALNPASVEFEGVPAELVEYGLIPSFLGCLREEIAEAIASGN